jgi:chromosome segregation ATPase
MRRKRVRRWLGVALLLMITFVVAGGGPAGMVSGQTARPTATLDDLLAEVRGLRAEINHVAAASIRAQLLVTRLSLQEQRIRTLADGLAEAQRMLRTSGADRRARSAHLERLEDTLRDATASSSGRGDLEAMLRHVREGVDRSGREEQALRAQEQELLKTLSAEETLWLDFNSRLAELERALPPTR